MDKNFENLKVVSREFTRERDWDKFHSPKNLIMSMFKEIGELSEIFQWKDEKLSFKHNYFFVSKKIILSLKKTYHSQF